MAFTYDDTTIGTSTSVSRLRYLVGDTVEARSLLTDAECSYLITTYATADAAAIPACRKMLREARRLVNYVSGSEREDLGAVAKAIQQTLSDLIAEGFTDPTSSSSGLRVAQFARQIQGNIDNSEFNS
jgi:hypothetical protein